jgi:hypothetical protein
MCKLEKSSNQLPIKTNPRRIDLPKEGYSPNGSFNSGQCSGTTIAYTGGSIPIKQDFEVLFRCGDAARGADRLSTPIH